MPDFRLRSKAIDRLISAPDQMAAFDDLAARPADHFGLLVIAEDLLSGEEYPIVTALLLRRWGREPEAERFEAKAREMGLSA